MGKAIKNRLFAAVILGSMIWMAQTACTREYIENVNPVCFETDVLPIFQSNCTQSGCHNSVDREKGYDLTSYDKIVSRGVTPGDYKGSEIYKALVVPGGESMPPAPFGRLSDEQITNIALWIEQGANNTINCGDSGNCVTDNVTYNATVKPILQKYCTGCHSGSAPSGNISYATYNATQATALSGALVGSVERTAGYSPMPQNAGKIPACDVEKLRQWVALGAKND